MQDEIKVNLDMINHRYESITVKPLEITLGDEFQGMFMHIKPIFEMLLLFESKLEVDIRYGVGIGEIYTDINYQHAMGSDGPTWWHAREAINIVKEKYERLNKNNNVYIKGMSDVQMQDFINDATVLIYQLIKSWSKKKLTKMIENNGLNLVDNQKKVAQGLGIEYKQFNRIYNHSNYEYIVKMMMHIDDII